LEIENRDLKCKVELLEKQIELLSADN